MNLQKTLIFLTLFLDVIGIAIIIPAFPELKLYYGINDTQVVRWLTIYSLCAFLAAPFLWQYSDKYGRKWPLVVCVLGTMISYLLLLITKQYWLFIVSRIINGITWGNVAILQAILTDISPDRETRGKNFGLMGAIFGMWFIIWPLVGALLLKFGSVTSIFWFGALFALIESILLIVHFSNTNHPDTTKKLNFNSFSVMRKYLRQPALRNFLLSLLLIWVGWFMINSSQSLYMNHIFGVGWEQYGYFLAIMWLISAFSMWWMTPKFWIKYFSNRTLVIISHITLIVWYTLSGIINSLPLFILCFYTTVFFSWFNMTVYNMEIIAHGKPNEIGELTWMLSWLQSMSMFLWPLLWSFLITQGAGIYRGAAVCCSISLALMMRFIVRGN